MNEQEKELLFIDLCGRLPYGVKCAEVYPNSKYINKWDILKIDKFSEDGIFISNSEEIYGYVSRLENIKPYLFPLSSMTLEQRCKVQNLLSDKCVISFTNSKIEFYGEDYRDIKLEQLNKLFNLFNMWNIDYRGLIPMGLAIDVTGKNIY